MAELLAGVRLRPLIVTVFVSVQDVEGPPREGADAVDLSGPPDASPPDIDDAGEQARLRPLSANPAGLREGLPMSPDSALDLVAVGLAAR